jgi:lysozyme
MDKRVVVGVVLVFLFVGGLIGYGIFKNQSESAKPRVSIANDINVTYGIDVSSHQKKIQWGKVKSWNGHPIKFVYCRATMGTSTRDKSYQENFYAAKRNGLLVGSYHLFTTRSSPETQFRNFIKVAKKEDQDLIPAIDLELYGKWSSKEYHKNLKLFLDLVENHYGKKPLLYSVQGFYNSKLKNRYRPYHLWIARYNTKPPHLLDGARWEIWQKSEKGKVEGISTYVDIDVAQNMDNFKF